MSSSMNLGGSVKLNPTGICILIAFCLLMVYIIVPSKPSSKIETEKLVNVNLKELLKVAIRSAVSGGLKVVEVRKNADINESSKGQTNEGANDPVTDGDMLSHFAMVGEIYDMYPYLTIVSEEKPKQPDKEISVNNIDIQDEINEIEALPNQYENPRDILVWIDPLDATQEYTEKLTQYVTTMVCIAVKGKPKIGVIHKPFTGFTAWGWVGQGYSKSLVSELKSSSPHKVIVSRSHKGKVEEITKKALDSDWKVIPAGGAGYKTLEVINKSVEVYVHSTLIKKWDICAGNAILESLGGAMTTIDGSPIDYSNGDEYKNEGGILAALNKHSWFVEKFKALAH